jgi:hypothetical protein
MHVRQQVTASDVQLTHTYTVRQYWLDVASGNLTTLVSWKFLSLIEDLDLKYANTDYTKLKLFHNLNLQSVNNFQDRPLTLCSICATYSRINGRTAWPTK